MRNRLDIDADGVLMKQLAPTSTLHENHGHFLKRLVRNMVRPLGFIIWMQEHQKHLNWRRFGDCDRVFDSGSRFRFIPEILFWLLFLTISDLVHQLESSSKDRLLFLIGMPVVTQL